MKALGALALFLLPLAAVADCYKSSVTSPTPMMGNHDEVVELDDKTRWRMQHEYEYLYEYYPDVLICPDLGLLFVGEKELDVVQEGKKGELKTWLKSGKIVRSQVEDRLGWLGRKYCCRSNQRPGLATS